jgi:phage gp46-like protein
MSANAILYHTADGGELDITAGVVATDGGLSTAVYLSLFNGSARWWGGGYSCETLALLRTGAPTSSALRAIEGAAQRDLAWLVSDGYARVVTVAASMPRRGELALSVTVNGDETLKYSVSWGAT